MRALRIRLITGIFTVAAACSLAQPPTVILLPSSPVVCTNRMITCRIQVALASHLHGYSIVVTHDPALLKTVAVRKSAFLPASGTLFFSTVDSTGGRITIDESILGPSGRTGLGDLAEIDYCTLRPGTSPVAFAKADLRDTLNQRLDAATQGTTIRIEVETGLQPDHRIAPGFNLDQNYPNPFNPRTVVSIQLPVVSDVRLSVYDLLGREVATLVNERKEPGIYQATFDASGLGSGVYFYRLQAGDFVRVRSMLLVR